MLRVPWTRTHAMPRCLCLISPFPLKASLWSLLPAGREHRLTDSDRWAGKAFFPALGDKQRCGTVGWSQPALQEEICSSNEGEGRKEAPALACWDCYSGTKSSPFQVLLHTGSLSLLWQLVPPGCRDLPITSGVSLWGRKAHPGTTKDAISVLHTQQGSHQWCFLCK